MHSVLPRVTLALLAALSFPACGDDGSSADAADGSDAGDSEDGLTGGESSPVEPDAGIGDTGTDGPMLGTCELACDRVVDCAADACVGVDWQTAGAAQAACVDACDASLGGALLEADGCADVLQLATAAAPALQAICDATLCETACDHFAGCTVEGCVGFDPDSRDDLASSCLGWCDDETAGELLVVDCPTLVDSLQGDPSFAATCNNSSECAPLPECTARAEKTSGCLVQACDADSVGFGPGFADVLAASCDDPDECPTVGEAAYINDPATTCDSPGLVELPDIALFDGLCHPGPGASAAEVRAGCEAIEACPFFSGLATVDRCMASLALDAATATLVACLIAGADCAEQMTCF